MAAEGLSVSQLMEDIADVSDWYLLGSSLGLESSQLNVIEVDIPACDGSAHRRKRKVLDTWMKGKTDPSWRDMVSALMKMGEHRISEELRRKYSGSVPVLSPLGEAVERENKPQIKAKFVMLQMLVCRKLQAMDINKQDFLWFIEGLFQCSDHIPASKEIDDIFKSLTCNGLWDFLNFAPLREIIKKFGGDDEDIKRSLQDYECTLAGYCASTKLIDYINSKSSFPEEAYDDIEPSVTFARKDPRYFKRLSIKTDAKVTEKSIDYLIELWARVSGYLCLPSLIYLLDEIKKGCVCATWLIPPISIRAILLKIGDPETSELFTELGIIRVELEDYCLYEQTQKEDSEDNVEQIKEQKQDSSPMESLTDHEKQGGESQLEVLQEIVSIEHKTRMKTQEENSELRSTIAYKEIEIGKLREQRAGLTTENRQLQTQLSDLTTLCDTQQMQLRRISEDHERELSVHRNRLERQREVNRKEIEALRERAKELETGIAKLKEESTGLQFEICSRDSDLAEKTDEVALKEAQIANMARELEAKNMDLERLTATGTQLNTQLSRVTTLLAAKSQVHPFNPMAQLSWDILPSLPVAMSYAQTVVINGKVYVGGGRAEKDDDNYKVFCFDPVSIEWTTLPHDCPVRWFGLGEYGGQLVAVGGMERDDTLNRTIHTFDEGTKTWKNLGIPDMVVARNFCAVLNYRSPETGEQFLIVAGGSIPAGCTTSVEIYKSGIERWCAAPALLYPCYGISSAYISGTWYLPCRIIENRHCSDEILSASVNTLIQKAGVAAQYSPFETPSQPQVWKTLTNTAVYTTAIGSMGGALVAIGGIDRNFEFFQRFQKLYNNVDIYLPARKVWVRLDNPNDLLPNIWTATAALSPTVLLVIGGQNADQEQIDSVYKVTLSMDLDTPEHKAT